MDNRSTPTRWRVRWRVAVVVVGTAAIWALMVWISMVVFDGLVSAASRITSAVVVSCLTVLMIVAARRVLDRRSWTALKLQGWSDAWRPFLIGAVSFLLPSMVGLVIALVVGWLRITSTLRPVDLVIAIAFTVVTVLLLEALPEELIFRGYLYRNLSSVLAPLVAVFTQAVLFALVFTTLWVVSPGWDVALERGALFLGMGVVLGILRVIADSVWTPIGFHLAFQVVAQVLLVQPGIEVDAPGVVTVAGIVPAFVFAAAITLVLTRAKPNWRMPEPDESSPRSRD